MKYFNSAFTQISFYFVIEMSLSQITVLPAIALHALDLGKKNHIIQNLNLTGTVLMTQLTQKFAIYTYIS